MKQSHRFAMGSPRYARDDKNMERLNKVIAQSGLASRRSADNLIAQGKVWVNGHKASLGDKVNPFKDSIRVGKKPLQFKTKKEYFIFHKPKGYLTTKFDPEGKPTIYDLLPKKLSHLFPVGRLDFNSSGLLILTNDGDFAQKISHPKHETQKIYQVKVRGIPTPKILEVMLQGIRLPDGVARFKSLKLFKTVGKNTWFEVVVTEGRNRLIRRVFEKFGYGVLKLKRTQIDRYKLAHLPTGHLRQFFP
ncbi:MAG: rRNA pseudouridine synthase [Deltaproteobacteria bacterium]|nr:rRNA pseudouridine synthase [Deltaproteobacteria bacterium]